MEVKYFENPLPPNSFKFRKPYKHISEIIWEIQDDKFDRKIPVINLHYMIVKEAIAWCAYFIKKYSGQNVRIITGKGLHSKDGPILKPEVKDFLKKRNIMHGELKGNSGCLWAKLP